MLTSKQTRDNSTFGLKVALRTRALDILGDDPPVVLETHGGLGKLFRAVYEDRVPVGVVFEKDGRKAPLLAGQRPRWAVYQVDVVAALAAGVGGHLTVNLLDLDPYGSVLDAAGAFFGSARPRADRLVVVANDGGRQNARFGHCYLSQNELMKAAVVEFGNDVMDERYMDALRWMVARAAAVAGYQLGAWEGYYCGQYKQMTHFLAVFERDSDHVGT
jgi:hypothetical protein